MFAQCPLKPVCIHLLDIDLRILLFGGCPTICIDRLLLFVSFFDDVDLLCRRFIYVLVFAGLPANLQALLIFILVLLVEFDVDVDDLLALLSSVLFIVRSVVLHLLSEDD